MKITKTDFDGLMVIEPQVFGDERGFFLESWNQDRFDNLVAKKTTKFVQDNHSKSCMGTLRGLHFQKENTQGKLVRVTSGEVYDVVVDLRKNSSTFKNSFGIYLSSENKKMLWIPEGFAHGFLVTSKEAEFCYKCTDYYNPKAEVSIHWDDKDLNINWPVSKEVLLSEKDKHGISLKDFVEAL